MKLSKIQTEMLATVAKRGNLCVSYQIGRGQKGGKIDCGKREVNAALKLEDAGLLVRTSFAHEKETRRGHSVTYMSIMYAAPEGV